MTELLWQLRKLPNDALDPVRELASRCGLHAVYVRNAIERRSPEGETVAVLDEQGDLRLAFWFGKRGNLVVLGDPADSRPMPEPATIRHIAASHAPWRIALGPESVLEEIAVVEKRSPLVHRPQIYYGVTADRRDDCLAVADETVVRPAQVKDARVLVQMAIELNEADLNVPAWRVDKVWLRDSVRRRIRDRRTWVVGPPGKPRSKVDLGSDGSAGAVIEGVYTMPEDRGQGLARRVVASVSARLLEERELVCLHVDVENESARRCYEQAGMRAEETCRLLLRG